MKVIHTWLEVKTLKNQLENEKNISRKRELQAKFEAKMCTLRIELDK